MANAMLKLCQGVRGWDGTLGGMLLPAMMMMDQQCGRVFGIRNVGPAGACLKVVGVNARDEANDDVAPWYCQY